MTVAVPEEELPATLTEEERKAVEAALEAAKKVISRHPPSEPTPTRISENLRERAAQRIAELRKIDEAYQRLQRKVRNFVLNAEYRTALRILEADPDYVKFRHHPRFKVLHDAIAEKLGRTRRRE